MTQRHPALIGDVDETRKQKMALENVKSEPPIMNKQELKRAHHCKSVVYLSDVCSFE